MIYLSDPCLCCCVFVFVSQMEDGSVQRDFRQIKTLAQVTEALLYFTRKQLDVLVSSVDPQNTSYITLLSTLKSCP